jgi:hypothetical protein
MVNTAILVERPILTGLPIRAVSYLEPERDWDFRVRRLEFATRRNRPLPTRSPRLLHRRASRSR